MKRTALFVLVLCYPVFAGPSGYTVTEFLNQSEQAESHLMRIDLSTGDYVDLGEVGIHTYPSSAGLAFADGQLYAVARTGSGSSDAEFWNLTTPPGFLIGNPSSAQSDSGLAYDRTTGTMYMLSTWFMVSELLSIDVATGNSAFVAGSVVFTQYDGLAIDGQGDMYAASLRRGDLARISLTGASTISYTLVGSLGVTSSSSSCGLSFDELDRLWMLSSDGSIYTVDTATGAATFVAASVANNGSLAINPIPVIPEPSSMFLLGLGLTQLAGIRRTIRRRHRIHQRKL